MACIVKEKLCPWSKEAKSLVDELVFDHPWLWTGIAFVVGMILGRKRLCCRRKKCED